MERKGGQGGQNVLTLKEGRPGQDFDPETTFRLFPVISGEDEIKYGTYARINHPQTKTWLHACKGVWCVCTCVCVCVCMYDKMWSGGEWRSGVVSHGMYGVTIIREIFGVKIFLWLTQPTKIYHLKYF